MVTAWVVAVLLGAGPFTPMSDAQRKATVAKMSHDELDEAVRATPPTVMLTISKNAINALGTYRYVMKKKERIKGTLTGEQTVRVTVREKPSAVFLEYEKGPSAGRKVVYNSTIEVRKLRAREAGVLSVFGGIWLDIDAGPTRDDSNHAVTEAGLGALVRRLSSDLDRAGVALTIEAEGWKGEQFCQLFTLPKGQTFEHAKTRVCFDPRLGVPTLVEGFDAKGELLERYAFSELEPITADDTTFDPKRL